LERCCCAFKEEQEIAEMMRPTVAVFLCALALLFVTLTGAQNQRPTPLAANQCELNNRTPPLLFLLFFFYSKFYNYIFGLAGGGAQGVASTASSTAPARMMGRARASRAGRA
jgi:hypothetical protein